MPIAFACKCGKRLVAKEEYAGKKMKCPQCAKVLVIPAAAAKKTTPARPSAPAAPPVVRSVRPSTGELPRPEITPKPSRPAAPTVTAPTIKTASPPPAPVKPSILQKPAATRPPSTPSIDLSAPDRSQPTAASVKPHPWIDASLSPTPTPWRPGDRERFQRDIHPMREGTHPLVLAVSVLCVVGACVGGAFWMKWI